ncbi:DNA repair exonuclease [Vibrio phage pYD21-A]|uniref:DNA repair exonuclease n=1 Tax=Vibrio phage pYD21-A TaxID=754049 RepID=UPI0002C10243|nr:DNA repair exonuclease [Vibrio phage pYD21-A]AGH16054.1 hypothetical protein VPKG_00017 [Vibrio phage pYD21-A]
MPFNYKNPQLDELDLTEKQREALEVTREYGVSVKSAELIQANYNSYRARLEQIRKKAAKMLPDLHDSTVHGEIPEGYAIKGVSNMVENSLGKPMWVKTDRTEIERYNAASYAVGKLLKYTPVREEINVIVDSLSDNLLNQYTVTDYHIGMLAWHKEGGDNWNTEIALRTLKQCFTDMISRAPKAKTCIINQLGDFGHYDSLTAETPTSGHPVDSDTRPAKMVECSINAMDYMIAEALRNHDRVIVVIAQGNHDLFSSIWLRKMFSYMYKNNERVEFVNSETPFYAMEWGVQMLGYHHGHKVKFDKLPSLFMDQFREMYGRTTKTAIHMGHYHHQEIKEVGTTVVEMHRTLAARDAHASYGGYHSERASDVITYHKDYGEISRCTVRPLLFGDC